jgi:hypothetical protein
MYRITSNPILVRFTLWMVAAVLVLFALLFWGGGLAQLLERINDLFLIHSSHL